MASNHRVCVTQALTCWHLCGGTHGHKSADACVQLHWPCAQQTHASYRVIRCIFMHFQVATFSLPDPYCMLLFHTSFNLIAWLQLARTKQESPQPSQPLKHCASLPM
eukprot:1159412-Pelagomonas_calceolata.AAC.1